MTTDDAVPSNLRWRRIDIVSGQRSHTGWWRELGEQVNLECAYGRRSSVVGGRPPDRLAADMLFELVKRRGCEER